MRELFKRIKTNSIITAGIYALLGLVLLLWPTLSASVLCMALGVVLAVCGVVDIFIFLINRDGSLYAGFHLVLGIILVAVGVWLMASPTLIAVLIPRIIGVLICIHGASDIGYAATLRRGGDPRWNTALVLGLVTLVLGAVLVVDPFDAFTTVVRVIGAFLLYDGVIGVWISMRVSKTLKQAVLNAEAEASAVDVEFRDVEDR